MVAFYVFLFCFQAVFLDRAYSACIGSGVSNINGSSRLSNLGVSTAGASLLGKISTGETPLKITSATFTPINSALANQAGLPGATISEVVPNLQFGDVTVSGDLPIGGTIKVSGCFPVYGMVGVDGTVPSSGTAVATAGCQFPAQLQQNAIGVGNGCA